MFMHLGVLLRKNYLLKRAHPLSLLSEIVLPLAFVLLLVGLQRLDRDRAIPARDYTCPRATAFSPTLLMPSPNDTVGKSDFFFSVETIGFGPGLQTVPPLLYVLALAAKVESRIALVNGGGEAEAAWLDGFSARLDEWTAPLAGPRWRAVSRALHGSVNVPFCRWRDLAVRFESAQQLDDYVASNTYGQGGSRRAPVVGR
jgi:hypothetical protein